MTTKTTADDDDDRLLIQLVTTSFSDRLLTISSSYRYTGHTVL